jgi:hypothetical protein
MTEAVRDVDMADVVGSESSDDERPKAPLVDGMEHLLFHGHHMGSDGSQFSHTFQGYSYDDHDVVNWELAPSLMAFHASKDDNKKPQACKLLRIEHVGFTSFTRILGLECAAEVVPNFKMLRSDVTEGATMTKYNRQEVTTSTVGLLTRNANFNYFSLLLINISIKAIARSTITQEVAAHTNYTGSRCSHQTTKRCSYSPSSPAVPS